MKGKVFITFIALFFGITLSSVAQSRKFKKPHHKGHYHKVHHRPPGHPGAVVVLPVPPRPPRPSHARPPRPHSRPHLPPPPPRPGHF